MISFEISSLDTGSDMERSFSVSNFEALTKRREDLEKAISKLSVSGTSADELRTRRELDEHLNTVQKEREDIIKRWKDVCENAEVLISQLLEDDCGSDDISVVEDTAESIENELKILKEVICNAHMIWVNEKVEMLRGPLKSLLSHALDIIRARKYAAKKAVKNDRDVSEQTVDGYCCTTIESLMDKTKGLLQDRDALPSAFTAISQELKAAIDETRMQRDEARSNKYLSKHLSGIRIAFKLSEARQLVSQLKDRLETWKHFRETRSTAHRLIDEIRKSLQTVRKKKNRLLSEAIVDLDVTVDTFVNFKLLRETLGILWKKSDQLNHIAADNIRFLCEYDYFLDKQAKYIVDKMHAEIEEEESISNYAAPIADDLQTLKNSISLAAGKTDLESISHQLIIVESHFDELGLKICAVNCASREFLPRDNSHMETLELLLQDIKQKLLDSDTAHNEFLEATTQQLHHFADMSIDLVPFTTVDSLEKQLIRRFNLDDARNQLMEIDKLREKMVNTFQSEFLKIFKPSEIIGQGAFGCVFKAECKLIEKSYAVKRISLKGSNAVMKTALNEVKSLAAFDHQGIVRYNHSWIEEPPVGWQRAFDGKVRKEFSKEHCDDEETNYEANSFINYKNNSVLLYIKMELGKSSLKSWIRTNIRAEQRDPSTIRTWFTQIVSAVAYIHEHNYMHRDLKPGNILIFSDDVVKICDLGVATVIDNGNGALTFRTDVGTPLYKAPEQDQIYDHRVDIYSMGLVLLEMSAVMTKDKRSEVFSSIRCGYEISVLQDRPTALDLITKLTKLKREQRPTIEAIRKHAFFSESGRSFLSRFL